jgi:membrane-bound lytic murein transglycosylase F
VRLLRRRYIPRIAVLAAGILLLVGVIVLLLVSRGRSDLGRIREEGRITVITHNSQHAYYIDGDQAAGFEYELAAAFADELGVQLAVRTPPWSEMVAELRSGEGDFIAAAFTNTHARRERLDFTEPYLIVRQHLIVHASNYSVRRMADMFGMTVHVREGTSYEARLRELKAGGLQIDIVVHPDTPTEELIRAVHEEEIQATVADTHIARLNRRYYPDVRMAVAISGPQALAWAVRPGSDDLRHAIDSFFDQAKDSGLYYRIHDRYYGNIEIFDYVDIKVFHERVQTRLPRYEDIFRREARRYGFDWRLIAAMAYQESHYHPLATSYTGVRGLMQVTLDTAREMGIENRLDPAQSVHAGVKYLASLRGRFNEIDRDRDRLLMAMAAYNVGLGHVRDAQRIARKRGLDPARWSSIEETLPLLSMPEYYRDARHGYARGREPVRYVDRILTYYDILKQLEPKDESEAP